MLSIPPPELNRPEETANATFEQCLDVIDQELKKRRGKWRLSAINWMDWEDVANQIRFHIYTKWYQYKPELGTLPQWLNKIISNQITNEIKKRYSNFSRPCLKCAHNQGEDLCHLYGKQCADCPIYALWCKRQKRAYDVKLPVSLESKYAEDHKINYQFSALDFDELVPKMHEKIQPLLTERNAEFYQLFYIDGKTEEEIGLLFGYKSSEEGRKCGYKAIQKIKKQIYIIAREIVSEVIDN